LATPPSALAAREDCPVIDEPVLCAFAIQLQTAMNSSTGAALLSSVLDGKSRPCQSTFAPAGEDIGCDSETDTSDPVVKFFPYYSDCCWLKVDRFLPLFEEWLASPDAGAGQWRAYGILEGSPFWERSPAVFLARGSARDAPVIEVSVTPNVQGTVTSTGLIHGNLDLVFVFPEATLFTWP
jgi:hypothetical protein